MTLSVGIFRDDDLLSDVRMVYVNGEPETKKPVPVPQAFVDAVVAFEKVAPERKV